MIQHRQTIQGVARDVRMVASKVGPSSMLPNGTEWNVALTYQGRTQFFPYHTGSAIKRPCKLDVVAALHRDAVGFDDYDDHGDIAEEFDLSCKEAQRIYEQMQENDIALRFVFGDDFAAFLEVENDY